MAQNGFPSPIAPNPLDELSKEEEPAEEFTRSSVGSRKSQTRGAQSLDLNESSPFLEPVRVEGDRASQDHDTPTELLDWNDGQDEKSKSVFYLFILTLGIGG